jgi:hypothetical protein
MSYNASQWRLTMQSALAEASITMDPAKAREKVAEYLRSVRARHTAEDAAILKGYKALARGRTIIDLPKCIRLGGEFDSGHMTGLPRVAVATASHAWVWVTRYRNGQVNFLPGVISTWGENRISNQRRKDCFRMPAGTLSPDTREPDSSPKTGYRAPWDGSMRAMVPHVPPGLRPGHSLANYQILFEVEEWAPDPTAPRDPALLKHIGGDLYAVLATWDLTPLEQSVLNGRVR